MSNQLTLLPEPPFAPAWPSPCSLAAVALECLLAGTYLDHDAFTNLTGSWRLAAYISELTHLGWPVQTVNQPAPTATAPGRGFASYRLPAEAIAAALSVRPKGQP